MRFAKRLLALAMVAAGVTVQPAVTYAQSAPQQAAQNVDAGVVHIMKRQREGGAYVRP